MGARLLILAWLCFGGPVAGQEALARLNFAEGLEVYHAAIDKIGRHHLDAEGASTAKLFTAGLNTLQKRLDQPTFAKLFTAKQRRDFSTYLESARLSIQPKSAREARLAVEFLCNHARRVCGLSVPQPIVQAFLDGAVESLDEYTRLLPPSVVAAVNLRTASMADGWFRIASFDADTAASVQAYLQEKTPPALVMDLRGNPGGSVLAAVETAKLFSPAGPLVRLEGRTPLAVKTYEATNAGEAARLPLLLLVDAKTASSAELFSQILAKQPNHEILGPGTYGKSTMQVAWPLPHGVGQIQITSARLLHAAGEPLVLKPAPASVQHSPEFWHAQAAAWLEKRRAGTTR